MSDQVDPSAPGVVQTFESAAYAVEVWPDQGGTIARLHAGGADWLVPPVRWESTPHPAASFVDVPVGGWDEMLPTIDACVVDGVARRDHGDVWCIGWERAGDGLEAVSASSGCRLSRTITVDERGIRLDYALSAERATSVLWAAHPLFAAPAGTRVMLPAGVDRALDVANGELVDWPVDGVPIDDVPDGAWRKYVLAPQQRVDRAAIVRPDGVWLRLRWAGSVIEHLAVYLDGVAFVPERCIAIEPMAGWYDSLTRAIESGTALRVAAGESIRWWIEVDAGHLDDATPF